MNLFSKAALLPTVMIAFAVPAFAGVTVNSPTNDSTVSSPFTLSAYATTCGSENVVSMGYSFDSSPNADVVYQQSIDKSVAASSGAHTLHVKAWAPGGVVCVQDVKINVTSSVSASTSDATSATLPSYANTVSDLQVLSNWSKTKDGSVSGSASGYTDLVSSPSLYGTTRRFITSFTNDGAERYSTTFGDDTSAKNFFYDGWVYLTSSSSQLANLELDINQVMSNGQTVLTGVQCDGWSGTWAYTANEGSASDVKPHWVKASGTSCNPQKWSTYKWHHIQFSLSRDDSGYVTYHSVWLDGVRSDLNATVFGGANLGWGKVINTQFQVDGYGSSGQVTAYLDDLKISMW
jgi:hypothetical protein